jgi:DNA-binding transcriptional regulator YhcF (GntR family)
MKAYIESRSGHDEKNVPVDMAKEALAGFLGGGENFVTVATDKGSAILNKTSDLDKIISTAPKDKKMQVLTIIESRCASSKAGAIMLDTLYDLAGMVQVSKTDVDEAIKDLKTKGMIYEEGSGVFKCTEPPSKPAEITIASKAVEKSSTELPDFLQNIGGGGAVIEGNIKEEDIKTAAVTGKVKGG